MSSTYPNNAFIVRKAKIGDLKQILELNFGLFRKEYREFDKSLDLEWTRKEGKNYFRHRIMKDDGFVEVTEFNGKIIGYICGGLSEKLSYRKKAGYAELENMFVAREFRGRNLGARLTGDFIKWCRDKKVKYVSVRSSAKNEAAIGFYRRLGFREYDLVLEKKLEQIKNK